MSLKATVMDLLQNFLDSQTDDGAHAAVDLLRVLREEAHLLYEKQKILDLFDQDPFHCFRSEDDDGGSHVDEAKQQAIARFQQSLEVASCHHLSTGENYCLNEAVVRYDNNYLTSQNKTPTNTPRRKRSKTQQQKQPVQLFFRYERRPATDDTVCSIWYSIDYAEEFGPRQNLLLIRVWAQGNKPSRLPAVSVDDEEAEDDDDWEDIDEVMEHCPHREKNGDGARDQRGGGTKQKTAENGLSDNKSLKSSSKGRKHRGGDAGTDEPKDVDSQPRDHYACFLDPDLLHTFVKQTNLSSLDEAAAFFVLMTFPYYEHEWDLVGFVLDSVFGSDDDADDDE